MAETIIVAVISFAGTLCGVYFANRKSTALIAYRMEQLEKKVDKHNTVIERTYRLEENEKILDEKMKVANHRIDDLEGKK
jgi:MFS superfamily sulfate permease-like transporter